jgi:hypothetical protein
MNVAASDVRSEDNISREAVRGELPRGDENQSVRHHLGVRR